MTMIFEGVFVLSTKKIVSVELKNLFQGRNFCTSWVDPMLFLSILSFSLSKTQMFSCVDIKKTPRSHLERFLKSSI